MPSTKTRLMTKTESTDETLIAGLYCGAARASITPPEALLPDLRALRDERFGGVLDDIYLRVIAVGSGSARALIVALELDKAPYPAEILALLSEHTSIPQQNIFYFSVHNHTSPVTGDRPEEGPNDISRKPPEVQAATRRYEKQVLDTLFRVVDEALASMRPARMGYGRGESYINVNRNQMYEFVDEDGERRSEVGLGADPAAAVDRTVFVLRFEDLDGMPLAFLINYPVHNCVLIGNRFCDGKAGIAGDLSGRVCRAVEEKFPGCTAVWSSGAAGDVNPVILNEMYYPDPETGRQVMAVMGEGCAAALDILAGRHITDVMGVIQDLECGIDHAPIAGTVAWSLTPGRDTVRGDDGTEETKVGDGVDPYEIRLHLVRIGEVALYGFSGELYTSLGLRLKEISPLENTVLINHDASMMARSHYILDDKTLARAMSPILPGSRNTHMLPGYVLESLEKHTLEMFAELKLTRPTSSKGRSVSSAGT
jgi:neutral ceramidase